MPPEQDPEQQPRPGFIENFANQETRWKPVAGQWLVTPEGVEVTGGRVAAWYVCSAVRPPDHAIMELLLHAEAPPEADSGVAALSVMTDQGHRAMSAGIDAARNRLVLFGSSATQLAQSPLPAEAWDVEYSKLVIHRNGPIVTAQVGTRKIAGSLRRSIDKGLLAFWTDPGVDAIFHRLSIWRGWEIPPLGDELPPDLVPSGSGTWTVEGNLLRFTGAQGTLRKTPGNWRDVQIEAEIRCPRASEAIRVGLDNGSEAEILLAIGTAEASIGEGAAVQLNGGADRLNLVVRRVGEMAYAWVDGQALPPQPTGGRPGEFILVASSAAEIYRLKVVEWI